MCPKGAVSRGERGIWVVVLSSGLGVRFRLHPPPRLPLQGPRHRSSRISPRGLRRRRAFEFCPHRRVCRNPKSGTLGSPAAVRSSGLGWSSAPPTPIPRKVKFSEPQEMVEGAAEMPSSGGLVKTLSALQKFVGLFY